MAYGSGIRFSLRFVEPGHLGQAQDILRISILLRRAFATDLGRLSTNACYPVPYIPLSVTGSSGQQDCPTQYTGFHSYAANKRSSLAIVDCLWLLWRCSGLLCGFPWAALGSSRKGTCRLPPDSSRSIPKGISDASLASVLLLVLSSESHAVCLAHGTHTFSTFALW